MSFSIVANHAKGKATPDKIFAASDTANKAAQVHGKENVINATIGAILDENRVLSCLPTIEKNYRKIETVDLVQYAPIAGLPEYLSAVVNEACGESRPDAHIAAVATAGGTGCLHHVIWNYAEIGDKIITSDWYWDAYSSICKDMLRTLDTYTMFDENKKYNIAALEEKIRELAVTQNNVVVIINTPAHNPIGYSVSNEEWDDILQMVQTIIKETGKNIVLLVDLAYIDYAGEREAVRSFIKKFENLPKELLIILSYSMSKGYTLYGQRTGAMIGISSDEGVIEEFASINQFTSRATWSNINRPSMRLLANICKEPELLAAVCKERNDLYQMIKNRADIFTREAKEVGLDMLPYIAGFFLSMPSNNSTAVCEKLKEDLVFAVPLTKGVRIAVCAVPEYQIRGLAAKVKKAFDAVEK